MNLYSVIDCPRCYNVQVSAATERARCVACGASFVFFERKTGRSRVRKTFEKPAEASEYCRRLKASLAEKKGERIGHAAELAEKYNGGI